VEEWKNVIIRQFDNLIMEEWKSGRMEECDNSTIRQWKDGRVEEWNVEALAEIPLRRGNGGRM